MASKLTRVSMPLASTGRRAACAFIIISPSIMYFSCRKTQFAIIRRRFCNCSLAPEGASPRDREDEHWRVDWRILPEMHQHASQRHL